jgi:small GTP-binding protein
VSVFSQITQTTSQIKVAFIGYPKVGKTSMINLLLGKAPQLEYRPTIGLNFGQKMIKSMLGEHELNLWDFGGQKNFWPMYNSYLLNTKLCVVVTNSTPKGVLQTKMIIDWLNKRENGVDKMRIIAMANKQDLPGVMAAERVENVLRCPTYPVIAIDPLYRENVIEILKTNIEQIVKEE